MKDKDVKWISLSNAILKYQVDPVKLKILMDEKEIRWKVSITNGDMKLFVEDKKLLMRIGAKSPSDFFDDIKRVVEAITAAAVGGTIVSVVDEIRDGQNHNIDNKLNKISMIMKLAKYSWVIKHGNCNSRLIDVPNFGELQLIRLGCSINKGRIRRRIREDDPFIAKFIYSLFDAFSEYFVDCRALNENFRVSSFNFSALDISNNAQRINLQELISLYQELTAATDSLIRKEADARDPDEIIVRSVLWSIFIRKREFEDMFGAL